MGIAEGLQVSEMIMGVAGAVLMLILYGFYGLICKNEVKSDRRDDELFSSQHEMEGRYRNNDRELYQQVGDVRCEISYMKGFKDGADSMKDTK